MTDKVMIKFIQKQGKSLRDIAKDIRVPYSTVQAIASGRNARFRDRGRRARLKEYYSRFRER